MNKVVRCNKCEFLFRATEPEKIEDGEIWFYYIMCPECGTKYLTIITDPALRAGIDEILKCSSRMRKVLGANRATEDLKRKMARLSAKNKSAGDALRKKYRGRFAELVDGAYEDHD